MKKIAGKHEELADLYFQYKKFNEALEQLLKAQKLSSRKPEITMRISEIYVQQGQMEKAVRDLKNIISEFPQFYQARLKLGIILYNANRTSEALEQWENVLIRDPQNPEARKYIKQLKRDLYETN
jgi:tetratricopeptide (TPR) repeat protein